VVQVHHAAFALTFVGWAHKEIRRDLDLGWAEFPTNLVALSLDKDIAVLHDYDFARFNFALGKKAPTLDRAFALFNFWLNKSD
jgi:hypothetical protein